MIEEHRGGLSGSPTVQSHPHLATEGGPPNSIDQTQEAACNWRNRKGKTVETDTGGLGTFVDWSFEILKLLAAIAGIAAFLAIVGGLLRSMWSVTFGGASLIHPFAGTEKFGVRVNGLLADLTQEQQKEWRELVESIRNETRAMPYDKRAPLLDQGSRAVIEGTSRHRNRVVAPGTGTSRPIGPITVGGTSFSPDTFIALLDEIRSRVARDTIHGEYFRLGNQARLTATIGGLFRSERQITMKRPIDDNPTGDEMTKEERSVFLELVTDLAFHVTKHKLSSESRARTWEGYRSLLEGYLHQVRYARSTRDEDADKAIAAYERAIDEEREVADAIGSSSREYHLAHFQLGNLLYNRYRSPDNERARECYWTASASPRRDLRALAYSGVARSAVQAVTRFGHPNRDDLIEDADMASQAAVESDPDLPDARLGRGFALQAMEDWDGALAEYELAVELENGGPVRWRKTRSDDRFRRSIEAAGGLAGVTSSAILDSTVALTVEVPTGVLRYFGEQAALRRPSYVVDVRRSNRQVVSMALNNLGYVHMSRTDGHANLSEAERSIRGALDTLLTNKMAWANLAEICRLKDDFDGAVGHFQQALSLDPGYINAHNELALLYLWAAGRGSNNQSDFGEEALIEKAGESHSQAARLLTGAPRHHRSIVEQTFDQAARTYGFAVARTPSGLSITPNGP